MWRRFTARREQGGLLALAVAGFAVVGLAGAASAQIVDDFETGMVDPRFSHSCGSGCCGGPAFCEITNTVFGGVPLPSYMLFMDGARTVINWSVPEAIIGASVDVLDFNGGFNPDAGTTSVEFVGIGGTRTFGNDVIVANQVISVYADQDTLADDGRTPIGQIIQIVIEVGLQGAYDNITLMTEAPACPCETDGNSSVIDVFDLLAYLDLWFVGDPAADRDGASGIDVFDLLAFLDCWFAPDGVPGCEPT